MSRQQTTHRKSVGVAAGIALVAAMVAPLAFAHQHTGEGDMMASMDSNHDGSVSAAEHAAFARSMFERMDSNHDGAVSKAEMDAGMKAMHGGHMKNHTMEHGTTDKQDTSGSNDGGSAR